VGDPGRVAISWLQNTTAVRNNNAELAPGDTGWNVMSAQTLNGLGCAGGDKVAGFTVSKASSRPVHKGTICQGGTTCQAKAIDRRLGDYFANEIDSKGRTYIAVSDTRQGGSVSLPYIMRQTGGRRFIAPANRQDPPGHTGKGVGKGPDSGDSPYVDVADSDDDRTLPATGGGIVLRGLRTFASGLVLKRRDRMA